MADDFHREVASTYPWSQIANSIHSNGVLNRPHVSAERVNPIARELGVQPLPRPVGVPLDRLRAWEPSTFFFLFFLGINVMDPVNRPDFIRWPIAVTVSRQTLSGIFPRSTGPATLNRPRSWSWKKLGRSNESLIS